MLLNRIKHIVFDLGGVLLNIDPEVSFNEFRRLKLMDEDKFKDLFIRQNLLFDLETGKASSAEFRERIKNYSLKTVSDEEIDFAWNALLLDFPMKRFEMLKKLKKHFYVHLLSNTNEIHYLCYAKNFEMQFNTGFDSMFHKLFLSYEMGLRKPDEQIFIKMLTDGDMHPVETLFIDDTPENIDAALKTGIQAFHLQKEKDVTELMQELVQF